MSAPVVLKIALPVPLPGLFDYLEPPGTDKGRLKPGCRLRVPFGRKRLVGVLVGLADESRIPADRLRAAEALIDQDPVIDAELMALLVWAARYYQHPPGEVIAAALPRHLRLGQAATATERVWLVTPAGRAADMEALRRRAPRQFAVLEQLLASGGGLTGDDLADLPGDWRGALRTLAGKGLCAQREREVSALSRGKAHSAAPGKETAPQPGQPAPLELTPAQAHAVTAVRDKLGQFAAFLLDGVTGSGKTEVYLRIIATVLERGEQALVLVPEIGLTPQLLRRFEARFPVAMAVLHSGLTDAARLRAWRRAASGEAGLIIGTRSAVFTAMPRPGLIVVDEEHDTSFKQQDGFRYSARDLALVRAKKLGIPVLLGSATPALESLHNVQMGRHQRLVLPERPGTASHPEVRLIDLRAHAAHQGLSTPLVSAIQRHLDQDGQVLLFLNRRGYAPALFCSACGWVTPCARCDARMTVHQASHRIRCHHCGRDEPLPETCGECNEPLKAVGQGTERAEETLARLFPGAPVARIDRDTTQPSGAMDRILEDIRTGHTRLLVGTQMLTKGHHFPDVTLVAVLNADQGLFGSDFRSNERFAQTLVQVAGRAGRADRKGEVLIQTSYPDHPLLEKLIGEGYAGFARAALAERKEAGWPPFSRLALLRSEAASQALPRQFLNEACAAARRLLRSAGDDNAVSLLGPAPAPMERRAGRYRAQLLLRAGRREHLHALLERWVPVIGELPHARRVRWSLDVDPGELF